MKIYISGPMSGKTIEEIKEFFDEAETMLREKGYEPVNPAEISEMDLTYAQFMAHDINMLSQCDGIYMLPGWESSMGATIELEIAIRSGIKRVKL